MPNESRVLAQRMYKAKHKQGMPVNNVLEIVFALIDHWNTLHFYDRNQHHERIDALEKKAGIAPPTERHE